MSVKWPRFMMVKGICCFLIGCGNMSASSGEKALCARISGVLPDSLENQSQGYFQEFFRVDSAQTYNESKLEVAALKKKLNPDEIGVDSAGALFTSWLVYRIIPYWYGTPWAFEGYTAIPQKGEIACGYFVSTTLLHMGVNINRYKLAQQLPVHEAQTLALGAGVELVEGLTKEAIIEKLDSLTENGIYFLGLDQSHVGYLLKQKNALFVIHSNYIGAEGVVIEPIAQSEAFASYYRFHLAPISTNEEFIRKWLQFKAITVIEE